MFDPYHKWLGIPLGRRPPTHYQLLGISPNETDLEVIEEAFIRQTSHLRTYQSGAYAMECTKLLNELAHAHVALTDPAKRQEYDTELEEERNYVARANIRPFNAPITQEPTAASESSSPRASRPRRHHRPALRRKQRVPVAPIVIGVVLLLAVVVIAVIVWGGKGDKPETQLADRGSGARPESPPSRGPEASRPGQPVSPPAGADPVPSTPPSFPPSSSPSSPPSRSPEEESKPPESRPATGANDREVAKDSKPGEPNFPAKPPDLGGTDEPKPPADEDKPPSGAGGVPVALRLPGRQGWAIRAVRLNQPMSMDRKQYWFTSLPKEAQGGFQVVRTWEEGKTWLPPGRLTTLRDCTVYALTMTERLGEVHVDAGQLAALQAEGWKEVPGLVATSQPEGEGWKWLALKKSLKKGVDPAELSNQRWGMITAFVFK